MAYNKKTYRFWGSNEIDFVYKGRYGAKGEQRQKKKKATPEQVKRQNQWNRERRMRRLMKENFSPGDPWCTLKYPRGTRKPIGEVMRDLRNFLARCRRRWKKHGEIFRWIYRIEIGKRGGIHIHILVNRIRGKPDGSAQELPDTALIIQQEWEKCGRVHFEPVYSEGLFRNLASYMVKEPDEGVEKQLSLFPEEDRKKLLKYSCSRNLRRPVPEVKEYAHWTMRRILEEGPEPTPGYYIDPDSVECGINPVTGLSYLHFIEYLLDPNGTGRSKDG